MASIFIVDDNDSIRTTLSILLKGAGHQVSLAESGEEAIERLGKEAFDLVITDLKMRKIDGLGVVKAARACIPAAEVIVITAYGSIETAVQAMKLGACDFIIKSFDAEEFFLVANRALEKRALLSEVKHLRKAMKSRYCLNNIICKSQKMKEVLDVIERVSRTDSTILVDGETGVGKELVAKVIHTNSHRCDAPFVAINCGAIPESLIESELFGHVKGAFTGAIANKAGLFEEAAGGTIFLDEIGDMPLQIQTRLLRVLQEKEIRRVGSNKTSRIDVRVVSASNRSLPQLIKEGTFRDDLFYRLNTVTITIPPLRERREDIIPLIEYFLTIHSNKLERKVPVISREAMDIMTSYCWPGNIRELEHVIENTLLFARTDTIQSQDIPATITKSAELGVLAEKLSLRELEKSFILECLRENSWNRTKAAQTLGIGRNTLWRKLRDHNTQ